MRGRIRTCNFANSVTSDFVMTVETVNLNCSPDNKSGVNFLNVNKYVFPRIKEDNVTFNKGQLLTSIGVIVI